MVSCSARCLRFGFRYQSITLTNSSKVVGGALVDSQHTRSAYDRNPIGRERLFCSTHSTGHCPICRLVDSAPGERSFRSVRNEAARWILRLTLVGGREQVGLSLFAFIDSSRQQYIFLSRSIRRMKINRQLA